MGECGRVRATCGRNGAEVCRCWSMTGVGPVLAEVGPCCENLNGPRSGTRLERSGAVRRRSWQAVLAIWASPNHPRIAAPHACMRCSVLAHGYMRVAQRPATLQRLLHAVRAEAGGVRGGQRGEGRGGDGGLGRAVAADTRVTCRGASCSGAGSTSRTSIHNGPCTM